MESNQAPKAPVAPDTATPQRPIIDVIAPSAAAQTAPVPQNPSTPDPAPAEVPQPDNVAVQQEPGVPETAPEQASEPAQPEKKQPAPDAPKQASTSRRAPVGVIIAAFFVFAALCTLAFMAYLNS